MTSINSFFQAFDLLTPHGYLFMTTFLFICFLTNLLGFYVAGKATDSINDEVVSAFTLLGMMLLIGMGTVIFHLLLTVLISNFLLSVILPAILALVASLYSISVIYDLSPGKSILFTIISDLVEIIIVGILFFGLNALTPTLFSDPGKMIKPAAQTEVLPSGKMSYEEYIKRGGMPIEEGIPDEPFNEIPDTTDTEEFPAEETITTSTETSETSVTEEESVEAEVTTSGSPSLPGEGL